MAVSLFSMGQRLEILGLLLGVLALFSPAGDARGQSPYAGELRTFYLRYHESPTRLDEIREGLERAVRNDPHVDDLVSLAKACFVWGDVRATTRVQKLEAYDRGRQAAKRAVELDPRHVAAHFWHAANAARLGQNNWGIQSLFLLPTVRQEIQIVLDLDPGFTPIYALAGNVFYELPGLLGGDLDKAERMFRRGLELDPQFTEMRLGLGKTLIRKGQIAAGRRELEAVLGEKKPRYLADWTLKDSQEARKLLESVQGR